MNVRRLLWVALGFFLAIVLVAIGISARFTLSNITANPCGFIEDFFSQWSPALAAAGTFILAISIFSFVYENRRREEREQKQAIHSLHDEILWNLNNIIFLRFQISERLKHIREIKVLPSNPMPFELLETRVFDDLRSRGQLHLLEEIRMEIIPCYKLIRDYNLDKFFKPNHPELLGTLHEWLEKRIKDLEAKFKFLPRYIKVKGEVSEDSDSKSQQNHKESVHNVQEQRMNLLQQFVRKHSLLAFAVVAVLPIGILLYLAISFALHSIINSLLALGFFFDSLAVGVALYVALLGATRGWYILAIEFFIFGMFFKLFGLL